MRRIFGALEKQAERERAMTSKNARTTVVEVVAPGRRGKKTAEAHGRAIEKRAREVRAAIRALPGAEAHEIAVDGLDAIRRGGLPKAPGPKPGRAMSEALSPDARNEHHRIVRGAP
jgi:hypothetical protein